MDLIGLANLKSVSLYKRQFFRQFTFWSPHVCNIGLNITRIWSPLERQFMYRYIFGRRIAVNIFKCGRPKGGDSCIDMLGPIASL